MARINPWGVFNHSRLAANLDGQFHFGLEVVEFLESDIFLVSLKNFALDPGRARVFEQCAKGGIGQAQAAAPFTALELGQNAKTLCIPWKLRKSWFLGLEKSWSRDLSLNWFVAHC